MNSLWNDEEASRFGTDPLGQRVYTSRLLGKDASLVLHGGGNTSVKTEAVNIFGENEKLLYVKGSGWDLATIERAGFAPVKMEVLARMAALEKLDDSEMVRVQKTAMTDPAAPAPSVEAILHAIIPYAFVDHTHADALVTITNTEKGEEYIRSIYGDRVLVIPYVMPGFILAKKVYAMTRDTDWSRYEGMILMNHGVFTFDHDARVSYEKMIAIVSQAENFLIKKGVTLPAEPGNLSKVARSTSSVRFLSRIQDFIKRPTTPAAEPSPIPCREELIQLAEIRRLVARKRGLPVLTQWKSARLDIEFAQRADIASVALRGPLTPDHVIRTKRLPMIVTGDSSRDVNRYEEDYRSYFQKFSPGDHVTCLDPAPRWAVWPGKGIISFGSTLNEMKIVSDIIDHTVWAIEAAERFDHWKALPAKDIFEVEYWELEQAKLKKNSSVSVFQGKIVLVTGAASGIGRACAEAFYAQGATVAALDKNPEIKRLFPQEGIIGLPCDVTQGEELRMAVETVVSRLGGLDVLVSNAGLFPVGELIEAMNADTWQQSLDINLTAHQRLLQECVPYLSLGMDPAVIMIASKNVPAPGPGASAYSVAKAGLTQLARIAALELGEKGIRVNVVHPNQVFDTAIWTENVLESRARQYGLSVGEYKTNNILKTEITSMDVARLVATMAGPVFGKTTGAQVPIDGGNDRVI